MTHAHAYRGRTVVVTGGAGFIAGALVDRLAHLGAHVIVIDSLSVPKCFQSKNNITWYQADVSTADIWEDVLPTAATVFHLAAVEAPYAEAVIEREWRVNAGSVITLLESCQRLKVQPDVVLASSANVFGVVKKLPVNEIALDFPQRIWSAHKQLAENYLSIIGQSAGIAHTSLRLANVYGPATVSGADRHIVINAVMRRLLQGEAPRLYGNRHCVRDYLFIDDAVNAFLAAGMAPHTARAKYYVVGSGDGHTIEEAWQMLGVAVEHQGAAVAPVVHDTHKVLDPSEYRDFVADSSLFSTHTGWRSVVDLPTGLQKTAAWLVEQNKTLAHT